MTVLVGICDGKNAWLGCDSFLGNSESYGRIKGGKLIRKIVQSDEFRIQEMIIGLSGTSMRPINVLRSFVPPDRSGGLTSSDYITGPFIDKLKDLFSDRGWLKDDNGRAGDNGLWMLIGYDGALFEVGQEFEVSEFDQDYATLGAGSSIALGALAATQGIDPMRRLEMALEITDRHSPWVTSPFYYECAVKEGQSNESG